MPRPSRTGRGRPTIPAIAAPHLVLLEAEGEELLGGDVPRFGWRGDRLDESAAPLQQERGGPQGVLAVEGEEEAVAAGAGAAARAAEPLQERRDGGRRVDLDDAVQVADVDAEFEGGRGDDDAVARLRERLFRAAPFVEERDAWERKVVTPRARSAAPSCSTIRRESQKTRRFSPRCSAEITLAAFSTEPTWSSSTWGSGTGPASGRRPGVGGASPIPGARSAGRRGCRRWPTGRCAGGPSATRVSRSRTAIRCQPRSSPANACTSSTTTACRP